LPNDPRVLNHFSSAPKITRQERMHHRFECSKNPELRTHVHDIEVEHEKTNLAEIQSFANLLSNPRRMERETVTLNFSATPFFLGDDKKSSPSQSRRHIHADGLNGRRQASGLPILVMASLPKHGTRRARAKNPTTERA
jgi:hypothetical protein